MFTGIVEEIGTIYKKEIVKGILSLHILCPSISDKLKIGDSISTNGVCLTVTKRIEKGFATNVSKETLNRSTLKYLKIGDKVNLERAISINSLLNGHIVQGHIDGVGEVLRLKRQNGQYLLRVLLPPELSRYIVEKGSIAIDGVSLTIAKIHNTNIIDVAVIPLTFTHTIIHTYRIGQSVNIEVDILGKYIEKFLSNYIKIKRF